MIILGKVGKNKTHKAVFQGKVFLIPFLQYVEYFDLDIYEKNIELDLKSKEGIPYKTEVSVKYSVTNNPAVIGNAVEKMLGLPNDKIKILGANIVELNLQELALKDMIVKDDHLKLEHDLYNAINEEFEKYGLKAIDILIKFY
jgi:uncharacterized membrane protein YqiK